MFLLQHQESFRVDPSIVTSIVKAIDVFIWLDALSNYFSGFFAKIIERDVHMLQGAICPKTAGNGFSTTQLATISKLVETIIKDPKHLIPCQQSKDSFSCFA